jgi:CheY-like chemotaxis protein
MESLNVLLVDPDGERRRETAAALGGPDLSVTETDAVGSALDALDGQRADCVVTEYDLPDGSAFDLVERLRSAAPGTGLVVFTDVDAVDAETGDHLVELVDRDGPDAHARLERLVRTTVELHAQAPYPLPDDEPARVAAVGEAADGDRVEGPLERVCELAVRHFDADIAAVNILDEYSQQTRACVGDDWGPLPREDSVCTYTIAAEADVTAIEDIHDDPRFAEVAALRDLGIRAYLGGKVTSPGGHPIGTLCVFENSPRSFAAADREYVGLLAEVVGDLLADTGGSP